MDDEDGYVNCYTSSNSRSKKKKNIRIFVQRKRLSAGILHKSVPSKSTSLEKLTSVIEEYLNIKQKNSPNNKKTIVINYKPVVVNSRRQKSTGLKTQVSSTTTDKFSSTYDNDRRSSMEASSILENSSFCPKSAGTFNQESSSFEIPDVEDPLMFIELMYQQLFTEEGQLRSEGKRKILANCVQEFVTRSRRNSMVPRDSATSNSYQRKRSSVSLHHSPLWKQTSLSPSNLVPNAFNNEGSSPLSKINLTGNTSGQ